MAGCPWKSLCACACALLSICVHVSVYVQIVGSCPCLVKCLYITSICCVCVCVFVHKCVSVIAPSPCSCVGFFSRHSTMHGIPAGTVFSPPWKSQRQAARLSDSFSLSSASPHDLSALAVCGSISKHEDGQDRRNMQQKYLS